ncbi:MAG: hypothetical protein HKM93_00265 [Desulfobacteraceae bacterium]|nr:hypothetical protein [Desulfobacteraceae bacterium]
MENNTDSFAEKVGDRLDEIFGDTEESVEEPVPEVVEENTDLGYYPLRFLKATVLSIDWEITDEVMARFMEQVERLKETHSDDKILVPMLQMLHSTGKHVRVYRENAHPDSLKILKSIYVGVEKVITSKDMDVQDKKKILSKEITKFQALKAQIAAGQLAHVSGETGTVTKNLPDSASKTATAPADAGYPMDPEITREFFISAFGELKETIQKEFDLLRNELKLKNSK